MIFFTADTHFGHRNVIEHCNRPFSDVEEMDEALIANWNSVVGPTDVVWHLGDFALADLATCQRYLNRLNGSVHLILGNHDEPKKMKRVGFVEVKDTHYFRSQGKRIWLSHYAHRVWPSSHHGAWHLFGHSHGQLPPWGLSMDIGVDAWGYRPISFEKIKEYMELWVPEWNKAQKEMKR